MIPEPSTLLLLGLLSGLALVIGWRRKLLAVEENMQWGPPITLLHVVVAFAIYFAVSNILTPILGGILQKLFLTKPSSVSLIAFASWLNFLNSGTILVCLLIFLILAPKILRKGIWLFEKENHSYFRDFTLACFAWLVSFPLVVFVNQSTDWILMKLLNIQHLPEQLAVHFLKMTFGYPLYLVLTAVTITIFAPLVEETLFRGFLQSFIRKHLGSKQAIFITSILFAFFHYSPEQKLANLTIITSLFSFSLFLGLVYEKRKSLLSPILLHGLFNTVNVLNLYFLGGIPGGPL